MKGIPIDAIRKLARILITENVFIYKKKFYRQVVADAMRFAFTLTLANIFMWQWGKRLVHRQLTPHSQTSFVLPTIMNKNDFARIHCLLLNRPTIPEYEIASQIAKTIKDNPQKEVGNPL